MTITAQQWRPARPGEVWVLTHRVRQPGWGRHSSEYVGVFVDPPPQPSMNSPTSCGPTGRRNAAGRPATPAGHRYPKRHPRTTPRSWRRSSPIRETTRTASGFATFSLTLHAIDATEPPPGPAYILVDPHQEFLCVCGNAAHAEGFSVCDHNGVVHPDGLPAGWAGHMLCSSCGRIIVNDTGLVVGRLRRCRHCHAWVSLLEHPDAATDASLRGEIVWPHVDNGRSDTCPDGLTDAEPAD